MLLFTDLSSVAPTNNISLLSSSVGWTALSRQFDQKATLACTEVRFIHV